MRGRVCRLQLLLVLASAVILGPSPVGLATIFYYLRFETSIFVASYDSQGYGGGHSFLLQAVSNATAYYFCLCALDVQFTGSVNVS
jgi:hypothetical protein